MIFKLLHKLLIDYPCYLVWRVERALHKALRIQQFQQGKGTIQYRTGSTVEEVDIKDIKEWSNHPEMVFDVVKIYLLDGHVIQWLDTDGDLTALLTKLAGDKERKDSVQPEGRGKREGRNGGTGI
jgi:hypothetical protein